MSHRLADTLEREDTATTALDLEIDDAERARLAALGYISYAERGAEAGEEAELPDPRDRIASLDRKFEAMTRFAEGDEVNAVADLEDLLADLPDNLAVTAALAGALYGIVEDPRGEELYRWVLERRPGDLNATLVVGGRALARGKIGEARALIERLGREAEAAAAETR